MVMQSKSRTDNDSCYDFLLKLICYAHVCFGSFIEVEEQQRLSYEKLQRLGWSARPLKETLIDSIESYKEAGILD